VQVDDLLRVEAETVATRTAARAEVLTLSEERQLAEKEGRKAEAAELERQGERARLVGAQVAGVEEELAEAGALLRLSSQLLGAIHQRESKGGVLRECEEAADYKRLCEAFQVKLPSRSPCFKGDISGLF
jgi:hypothetical protein